MSFFRNIYDNINGGHHIEEAGKGTTLYIGSKTYQVMSDIWEQGQFAVYWDGREIRVADWIERGNVDATDAVWAKAKAWKRERLFDLQMSKLISDFEQEGRALKRGVLAEVVRGRKFPIGTKGKVVGFSQSQWGTSVGLATTDKTVEIEKNGKKFQNHVDVIWVATKNVEVRDEPVIPMEEIEKKAAEYADAAISKNYWFVPSNTY
jgi:hypothetical protein